MPKPVSHTPPLAASTRMLAGLRSLWISPRACPWPIAAASGIAMRMNCVTSHRAAEQPIERLAARVFKHQRQATIASGEGQRPRRPIRVDDSPQRVFVLEALE
jgi:hypothetical protein